jgi:hypothetical protein
MPSERGNNLHVSGHQGEGGKIMDLGGGTTFDPSKGEFSHSEKVDQSNENQPLEVFVKEIDALLQLALSNKQRMRAGDPEASQPLEQAKTRVAALQSINPRKAFELNLKIEEVEERLNSKDE